MFIEELETRDLLYMRHVDFAKKAACYTNVNRGLKFKELTVSISILLSK